MTFDLEEHGDPIRGYTALIVHDIQICHPDKTDIQIGPLTGLVDTGCDFAVIPQHTVESLDLQPVDVIKATTATGSQMVNVHLVHMQIPGIGMVNTFAIATPDRDTVLIGRRCVAHTKITIDWPAKKWSIESVAAH